MLQADDKITLENIVNKCISLNTKFNSSMNQWNSDEHYYADRISNETVSQNASTLRKTLTKCWPCNNLHFV